MSCPFRCTSHLSSASNLRNSPSFSRPIVTTTIVHSIWADYARDPAVASGVFSMFASKSQKISHYNISNVLTTAFAHIAVVPLYHLTTYAKGSTIPLQVTAEVMGGILTGAISMWDDAKIQAANPLSKAYLPNQPITVVIRSYESDCNNLVFRYLAKSSPTFLKRFTDAGGISTSSVFDFSTLLPLNRMLHAVTNDNVDSLVSIFDGSIGFFLKNGSPQSSIANFCSDDTCSEGPVDPTDLKSVEACVTPETIINPSDMLYTFDLMSSTATGCYPIVGTVDYSLLAASGDNCSNGNESNKRALKNRLQFASWLFESPVIVQPLAAVGISAASTSIRTAAFRQICDVTCDGVAYGYEYCNYRTCTWDSGDYIQVESGCDPRTERRTITYELKSGSTCKVDPHFAPPSFLFVDCSNVLMHHKYGKIATALSAIGMCVCGLVFLLVVIHRQEKIIKKSQPVFIYIFIFGAFMMNMCILSLIGENNSKSCLLRPWCFNISTTMMFAPLLMKLHRIDSLFRLSKKLKRVKIPDHKVESYRRRP